VVQAGRVAARQDGHEGLRVSRRHQRGRSSARSRRDQRPFNHGVSQAATTLVHGRMGWRAGRIWLACPTHYKYVGARRRVTPKVPDIRDKSRGRG
jgi:hypothetical protein